ncbi:MAG: hypothetical protein LBN36_08040 [Clostridiales Family XIII bacterium]|nr:hypothetical protein [Clostridiales Family XIII bacterium]
MTSITHEYKWTAQRLTATALLIAIGIVIPVISPFKIVLEPASFTLASHVAIFLAMMVSPSVAVIVTIGTFFGFFMNFPIVVALRAASHIVFAFGGSAYLKYRPDTLRSPLKSQVFSFFVAIVHAVCEVSVVFFFYFNGAMKGYASVQMVILLIGLGSIVHSMIDFGIAYMIYQALRRVPGLGKLFVTSNTNNKVTVQQ